MQCFGHGDEIETCDGITFNFYTGLPHCMKTPILSHSLTLHLHHHFHLPHPLTFLTPSPSSPSLLSPSSPLTPSPPSPSHPSPPHPSPPSQSGVTKEHAAADGQCGHTSTRLIPSPWLREEPGQTAAGETAVHSKKGKTSPHSQASSRAFIICCAESLVHNLTCQDCTVIL